MKKILSIVTALVLCAALMLPLTVSAAPNASATLTGPGTVRAGDTITLTFALNGTGLLGMEGSLSYDNSQVTLTGITQKVASPWLVEQNGNRIVAYDNQQTAPVNKSTVLFAASFKVSSSLSVGTQISISVNNCIASDGTDAALGAITYAATIAPPMSSDNTLKSLTVGNATLSAAFDPNTVSYSATVPFSISKLDVKAEANDSKAKVSVNSPNLAVGSNAVTITVTAENGTKKTYTIKVTRQQDPNYVASGENNLASLKVEGFLLSPNFSADKTQYVVWLPYETEQVSASGTPKDSKASVRVEGGEKLLAGQDNEIKVICVAENGSEKVYTIIAKRAAAHDGSVDTPVVPDTPDTPDDPSVGDDTPTPTPSVSHKGCMSFLWLIPAFLLGMALGVSGVVYFYEKEKEKKETKEGAEVEDDPS